MSRGDRGYAGLERQVGDSVEREITDAGVAPGAAVAIVKDGRIVLLRGYGVADVTTDAPVGARTLFRAGSVSKAITATAVMRVVEEGGLRLDADVNDYLPPGAKLPRRFAAPVTLKHLLTHTAGFEENMCGAMARRPEDLIPLDDVVSRRRAAQVRAPTADFTSLRDAAYSNWGICLAAHVARLKGDAPTFDELARRKVFVPLGMSSTTYEEPLPPGWEKRLARGHVPTKGGGFSPRRFEYCHSIGPACSLTTTAADMARFMLAHLGGGKVGRRRILDDATVALMHSRMLDPPAPLNGAGLGFYELHLNGHRLLAHRGFTLHHSAKLVLFPAQRLGIFIAVNAGGAIGGIRWVLQDFMDRYHPGAPPRGRPREGSAARHVGSYFPLARSYTRNDAALALFDPMYESRVTAVRSRGLRITNLEWPYWREIGPGVFRQRGGQDVVAFADGDLVGAIMPYGTHRRLRSYETPRFHRRLWCAAAAVFAAFLAATACRLVMGPPVPDPHAWLALARAATLLAGVLGFSGGWVVRRACAGGARELVYGFPPSFRLGLHLLVAAAVATAAGTGLTVIAWWRGEGALPDRIALSAAAAAALAFLWSMRHWNLLGYRYSWRA